MELTRLKKKLATAVRGHKLLKDKQDELVRQFIALVKHNNELRNKVEENLDDTLKEFMLTRAILGSEIVEEALSFPKESISVEIGSKNVMSVNVPVMEFKRKLENDEGSIYPYGFANTSPELDHVVGRLYKTLPLLLELAEVEKSTQLMADEIEKTRRRVNALVRLMKVKDMIEKAAAEQQ